MEKSATPCGNPVAIKFMVCAAALGLVLFHASVASAVVITIDDRTDTLLATPGFGLTLTQEAPGILGDASYHFEYVSIDPSIPGAGVVDTFNVNFFEPGTVIPPTGTPSANFLSDTLSITITGHVTADSNVTVDMSFLSDSSDDSVLPSLLADAQNVVETGLFQTFNPLTDLTVNVASDVPEPSSLALFGAGLIGFYRFARRRRRAV